MKRSLVFIFFVLCVNSFVTGQENKFTLSGIVTDCRTKDLIKDVAIKLVGNDGSSIETMTDSLGYYFFDSKKLKPNRQYVVTTQASRDSYAVKNPKTKLKGYINTSDKYKFSTYDSVVNKNIKADFCLIKNQGCTMRTPEAFFQKNSSVNYHLDDSIFDFNFLFQFMEDSPHLVMEIAGHASKDEKAPESLSKKRAEVIKEALIKKGIESDRLVIKAYSNSKPYQSFDEDTLETTIEDKNNESSYKLNRRVSIKIIRTDYISKNPPKEKVNTGTNPSEE